MNKYLYVLNFVTLSAFLLLYSSPSIINRRLTAPWPAVVVSIDGFSAEQKRAIVENISYINAFVNRNIVEYYGDGDPVNRKWQAYTREAQRHRKNNFYIKISKIGLVEEHPDRLAQTGHIFSHNSFYMEGCFIEITDLTFTSNPDLFPTTFFHEVGHCAGLHHIEDPRDVMYKYAHPFSGLTLDYADKYLNDVLNNVRFVD